MSLTQKWVIVCEAPEFDDKGCTADGHAVGNWVKARTTLLKEGWCKIKGKWHCPACVIRVSDVTLIPPDKKRCQGLHRRAHGFTLGSTPADREWHRCENKPSFIATEQKASKDGKFGSMSLCQTCKGVLILQHGENFASFKKV